MCRVGDDGLLTAIQVLGGLEHPSCLALNRRGDRLYTVHDHGSGCSVLSVDRGAGTPQWRHTRPCGARNPVHHARGLQDRSLIVSSHLTGVLVVLPVQAAGTLGDVEQRVALPGKPAPRRVEQPVFKPHFNPFDPSGRLSPAEVPFVQTREGAGPRNVTFDSPRRHLCAVNELDSAVTACHFDTTRGALIAHRWPPHRAVTLTGKAGSMSVRHVRTLHGSGPNVGDRTRKMLFYESAAAHAWPLLGSGSYFHALGQRKFWGELNDRMISGTPCLEPRLEAVPERMPLPPAPVSGSIFKTQESAGAKSALAKP